MPESTLIFTIFLIFTGAAILSTVALFTRQSLLVAYMLLGIVVGPWGMRWIGNVAIVHSIGDVGILFLLFLLGLNLPPQKLWHTLRSVSLVSLLSSAVFLAIGYGAGWYLGFSPVESLIVGAALMFSSTIIGIKLLPTTVLHHQHTGEVMIGILLLQDLAAIVVLLLMHGAATGGGISWEDAKLVLFGLPLALFIAFLVQRYVLTKLFTRFSKIREYTFLVAIAWCMVMAQFSSYMGLTGEVGAFIAGVSLAASPISMYIAESLRPIRDFFLVLFFFSVGATFDLNYLTTMIVPAVVLSALLMVMKPVVYNYLLRWAGEQKVVGWEVGIRLAQLSEFSLIIAYVGVSLKLLTSASAYLIEATTMLTFIASSYLVVSRYPTPVALLDQLRKD